jgi:hypothetical protein
VPLLLKIKREFQGMIRKNPVLPPPQFLPTTLLLPHLPLDVASALQNIKGEYQKRGRKPPKSPPSHHLPFPTFLYSTADTLPAFALLVATTHQNFMGNS